MQRISSTVAAGETIILMSPLCCVGNVRRFPPNFFHPNIYPDGEVCLSILCDDEEICGEWAPSLSLKQVLLAIQDLLDDPNPMSPAQNEPNDLFRSNKAKYSAYVPPARASDRPRITALTCFLF